MTLVVRGPGHGYSQRGRIGTSRVHPRWRGKVGAQGVDDAISIEFFFEVEDFYRREKLID